jgi:hypothetical protein
VSGQAGRALAAEQELLGWLEITGQTVLEVLTDQELPDTDAVTADAPAQGGAGAGVGSAPGMGTQVPAFRPGEGGRRLSVAYRDVVEVLADAGVPLRAMQVCQALDVGAEPRHREGTRSKLNGWSGVAGWSRSSRACPPASPVWGRGGRPDGDKPAGWQR